MSSVHGQHVTSYSNENVKSFTTNDKSLNFLSKDIGKYFPKIYYFDIDNPNLQVLSKYDLQFFENTRVLILKRSKIEVIDSDLFDFTPKIHTLVLSNNLIKSVGHGAFDKMPNLSTLKFENNPCYSTIASNDRSAVLKNIPIINNNCNDQQAYHNIIIQNKISSVVQEAEIKNLKDEISIKDEKITALELSVEAEKKKNQCDDLIKKVEGLASTKDEKIMLK